MWDEFENFINFYFHLKSLQIDTHFFSLLAGFVFAFFTGILACKWMIKLVKNSQLKYFAYYCFAVGGIVIITTFL